MNNDVLLLKIQTKRKCHKYFHENENRVYIIYTYQIEKKYIYVCMYILYMYNNSLPE